MTILSNIGGATILRVAHEIYRAAFFNGSSLSMCTNMAADMHRKNKGSANFDGGKKEEREIRERRLLLPRARKVTSARDNNKSGQYIRLSYIVPLECGRAEREKRKYTRERVQNYGPGKRRLPSAPPPPPPLFRVPLFSLARAKTPLAPFFLPRNCSRDGEPADLLSRKLR